MAANQTSYLQLLREQMGLFQQLADVRKEKNDLHDAKMRAWDEHRSRFESNRAFEDFWNLAKPNGIDEEYREREHEIFRRLDQMKTVLEHLRYAGLDLFANDALPDSAFAASAPPDVPAPEIELTDSALADGALAESALFDDMLTDAKFEPPQAYSAGRPPPARRWLSLLSRAASNS